MEDDKPMKGPQESVIRRMTRLAIEHNAVNLSQGITNEPVLYDLAWAGIAAILGGSDDGAEHLQSLTLSDLLSRNTGNNHNARSLKDLCTVLQPEQDRYNQYSFPFGLPELREAIADYTQRFYSFRPNPETQITVTAGATEGLSSTLRALCDPGDGLIILQPFHEMYPNQASLFGLRCEYVTLRETNTGWQLDKDEWTAAAKNARALILNTPHNPTGKVFSESELGFIVDLCQKHDLFLITDEIYEHILYGDHIHICPAMLNGMADRTIVI
ncbi:MAG: aminotransferase class I/II-fold pyridoxal phosphate-dependent enzyme, partial [Candidatus Latescibacteria bacterium]|nr:aminotransferase class I/II-fold pyridoxal phosphate-dependent enzyme [Candidatus Latescibacterota bacterium]